MPRLCFPIALRRAVTRGWLAVLCVAAALLTAPPVLASATSDDLVLEAREAWGRNDRQRLALARAAALAQAQPLAPWVDYWELQSRLTQVQSDEVEAFYTRWGGSYVEDRLRNDWLLELGHRRDWAQFGRDYPRFRMNDDREVICHALIAEHLQVLPSVRATASPGELRAPALAAWLAQREPDDGCQLMASRFLDDGVFSADEVWHKLRQTAELNRARQAQAVAALLGAPVASAVEALFEQPARFLARKNGAAAGRTSDELAALALARLAAGDPDEAASQPRLPSLPADLRTWVWAQIGRQSALKLQPQALAHYRQAWAALPAQGVAAAPWSDETLAWAARAALRSNAADRWDVVRWAVAQMSETGQRDATWRYWRARALREGAAAGADGDDARLLAQQLLQELAGEMHFYGALAADDLGQPLPLPAPPPALSEAERDAARQKPGLARGLHLIALGLRSEGVREWNFTLRGMGDRELLAAAQWACERAVWDRCINASDRTRGEVDLDQRFPLPYRSEVVAKAQAIGLDPAYVYGLIRQESRFVTDARSSAGASGLMQIMPATARWTARKIGMPFSNGMLADRDTNLKLGTHYLKLVLDSFDGSQPMAAAAYNAGPNRPRRWREGSTLEPAIWAENIPFSETRDYVKKVLSNAVYYGALLGSTPNSLRARLGGPIGPRDISAKTEEPDLP